MKKQLIAVSIFAGLFVAISPATSASAVDSSTTSFSTDSSQTVTYGTDWVMRITVAGTTPDDVVTPTSGTVNVLIKGVPGNYVTGLPLTPGGVAYLSPPSSRTPLTAGTYEVSAVYVPSGTAYLSASQTTTPATLTVKALSMSSSFSVNKTTINNKPAVQVVAQAMPPSATSGIPDGDWVVTAKDSSEAVAYKSSTPLAKNPADPVTITLDQKVTPGHEYTVSVQFVPKADVAGGYDVKNGAAQKVAVQSPSFGEIMTTPFAAPLWALIAIGVGLAALIAAAIVLLVQVKKRSKPNEVPVETGPEPAV